jgi:putative addiction module component (TIGR02574 family)
MGLRKLDDLAIEALELGRESRAELAKRLLVSLDEPSTEELGQGWVAEAERRYQEIKAGTARTTPSEEVFAALAARHQR